MATKPIDGETGRIAGPYWLSTATNGTHRVCGRHGKVIFTYRADQIDMAAEHVRRLQAEYSADDKRLRDAAPAMLEALQLVWDTYGMDPSVDSSIWQAVQSAITAALGGAK